MFKVGDRVRYIGDDYAMAIKRRVGTIVKVNPNPPPCAENYYFQADNYNFDWYVHPTELQPIKEVSMRERIEALTAWDKEADDICREIGKTLKISYYISIHLSDDLLEIQTSNHEVVKSFDRISNQYEKLQAFKDALLWLAEKAGKLDDKKDKIRRRIEVLEKEVKELKEEITP